MDKTGAAYEHLDDDDGTTISKVRAARAILEEATGSTTVLHRKQLPRVSWARRLLDWFKKS